jgi:hypothetical protein
MHTAARIQGLSLKCDASSQERATHHRRGEERIGVWPVLRRVASGPISAVAHALALAPFLEDSVRAAPPSQQAVVFARYMERLQQLPYKVVHADW